MDSIMNLVIFGLAISSSWGNGHATLWRGLCKGLIGNGHTVTFFERDVPYYAAHRDFTELPGGELTLYKDWSSALPAVRRRLSEADVAMVTLFCPDGVSAANAVLDSPARLRVFYDLDTPVTISEIQAGRAVKYIGPRGLADFDLVLSFTGGRAPAPFKGAKSGASLRQCGPADSPSC
jgi:spore maturation protein CgeB